MKKMKSKKLFSFNLRRKYIYVLFFVSLFMGVGYSYLAATLFMQGTINLRVPNTTLKTYDKLGFRSDTYLANIKNITLNNSINTPEDAIEIWDVSIKDDGSVIAYVIPNEEDNTMYDLYIEGKGAIYANPDSQYLFFGMINTEYINNLNILNTSNARNMNYMFAGTFNEVMSFKTLDVSNFDTSNVTNMNCMFLYCKDLQSLDLKNFNTNKVTDMSRMFENCEGLLSLDLSSFNTENVTAMKRMFRDCSSLQYINLSSFDTKNVATLSEFFAFCRNLISLDISNFDTGNITNMSEMFYYCTSLQELNIGDLNTERVTTMHAMFLSCQNLLSLDVTSFNTSNVTDMSSIFYSCSSLQELDVSNFDTRKVSNMNHMFSGCSKLEELSLTNFVTNNVTDMSSMFSGCSNLKKLDASGFNTSKVTDMYSMFTNCSNITNLDVSSFDTSNVTNMFWMFTGCKSLTSLDISNFDMCNVTSVESMFSNVKCFVTIPIATGTLQNTTTRLYGANDSVYTDGTFTLHTHTNGVTTPATCTEKGKTVYSCSNHTYTEILPSLGHNMVDGLCTRCGISEVVIETNHEDYGNSNNYIVLGNWNFNNVDTVDIEITYQTEGVGYDWLSITSGLDYVAGSSYTATRDYLNTNGNIVTTTGTNSAVKFGGSTKNTANFDNIAMPQGTVIFRSDGSGSNYYGAKVVIKPHV